MKLFTLLVIFLLATGCSLNSKTCNPRKSASVFESKILKIDKVINVSNETKIVIKSYRKPKFILHSQNDKILIKGIENYSIVGYHTDECTAVKMKKDMETVKPSVGFKVVKKGNTIHVETTGERRYIHHQNAFSEINISLPKNINYQYIKTELN
jgi:hypothetical protein